MKVSSCCHKKMTKHSINKLLICSWCWGCIPTIELRDIKKKKPKIPLSFTNWLWKI